MPKRAECSKEEVSPDSWSNFWDVWAARLSLTRGAPPRGDLLPKRCHTGRAASIEHTARVYTTCATTLRRLAARENL